MGDTPTDDRPGPGPHPQWPDPFDPGMPIVEELTAILAAAKSAHERDELATNLGLAVPAFRRALDALTECRSARVRILDMNTDLLDALAEARALLTNYAAADLLDALAEALEIIMDVESMHGGPR